MTISSDKITGTLLGLAAGDRIGGPLRMALCLSQSLISQGKFNADLVFESYLTWYLNGGFDTGPTTARVLKHVSQGISIAEAMRLVDKQAQGMTAGCNPMHRAIPLALSPFIADDELAAIVRQEAKLTHFHPLAGEVSAATVILCRKLIQGDDLETALSTIDTQDWLDRPLSHSGFAPDVFHAAVHFVRESDSFKTALGNSLGFAGADNYCPVVVGALAGAMYGASNVAAKLYSHCTMMDMVHDFSRSFTGQWTSKLKANQMQQPQQWVRMRLWARGHFTGDTTWVIYHKNNPRGASREPNLDYQIYVMEIDKLNNTSREAVLDGIAFNELIIKGKSITIPLVGIRTGSGLDGTIYGFEVPIGIMGFGDYRISWWGHGADEWQSIIEWYDEMVEFLRETLDKQ
jgi:ADP-ribosylglycohydrolase